jgi:hypothetical protein
VNEVNLLLLLALLLAWIIARVKSLLALEKAGLAYCSRGSLPAWCPAYCLRGNLLLALGLLLAWGPGLVG